MISSLVEKFKGLWYGESKQEVEGHIIMSDSTNNKTLLLVKNGDKSWKTKWYDDNKNIFKTPNELLISIFNKSK
jgi:hypothetical protein